MLHEILLSLSGHPSPLLNADLDITTQSGLSKPERELLKTAGYLSELHRNLIADTTHIVASHSSVICRATATAIKSIHLSAFQRQILAVEDQILRKDAGLVGAHNIVALTAVVGEFSGFTRKLEYLWELVQSMLKEGQGSTRKGADLINKLRSEQTGYPDIEETVLSLVKAAETAWLKQVSAWVLYGRLPSFGGDDFFIRRDEGADLGYKIDWVSVPLFVPASTASSMFFVGTSLNRVRTRTDPSMGIVGHLSSQLQDLAKLDLPISPNALSRAVTSIRLTLSRNTLQKLLPPEKVIEMLHLLRSFFLLGRGEFAMALTQQADEKMRGRWRRADNLAYEKKDGLGTVVVKEGEVAAVLARTWAALGSMQGQHDTEEDEELELARELIRLDLSKSKAATPLKTMSQASREDLNSNIATTPFRNLLLSVPSVMTLQVPSPVDLFLTTSDVQAYTSINSYLLSIFRSHLRLTDLWKISSLRRHHPAPPRPPYSVTRSGMARTRELRDRWSARSSVMRSTWTTSSAAIFFLAETEAYLQVEVVEGLWEDFRTWVTGRVDSSRRSSRPTSSAANTRVDNSAEHSGDEDVWMQTSHSSLPSASGRKARSASAGRHHDPETLSIAHHLYLRVLIRRLLLTQPSFTEPLYELLIYIDHLVALIHRLHGIWTSMDLEADDGVIDAFSNLEAEEADVKSNIGEVESKVKNGVHEVVNVLRRLSVDSSFLAEMEGEGLTGNEDILNDEEEGIYVPKRVGGVDRLLMKLDFGGWFNSGAIVEKDADDDF